MKSTRTSGSTRSIVVSACCLWIAIPGLQGCKQDTAATRPDPSLPAAGPSTPAGAPPPWIAPDAGSGGADAGTGPVGVVLSPDIPPDVTVAQAQPTLTDLQNDFDIYSWNTFISVNWPTGADGKVDPHQRPGQNGDNSTVWEGWIPATSIFLPGGKAPAQGVNPIPDICKKLLKPGQRFLTQIGKTPGLLNETVQPFDTGPLIDQGGNYARFEILVNPPMFDYLQLHALYSKAGQKAFDAPANFPCGDAATNAQGAIMVKAAWKPLEKPADAARFHTVKALVYTPATQNPKIQESCKEELVGLVGFHVAHKTAAAAQWIWSTFEHVDNVPTKAEVDSGTLKASYNFFNPACKDCPINKTPPRPWDPNKKIMVNGKVFASQIVRMDPLPRIMRDSAEAHNAQGLQLLTGVNPASVWRNYALVSTQWPTQPGSCSDAVLTDGNPAPQFLANTTLETYVQGNVPNVSSSCIRCHGNATMTNAKVSDFTYLLERAQ